MSKTTFYLEAAALVVFLCNIRKVNACSLVMVRSVDEDWCVLHSGTSEVLQDVLCFSKSSLALLGSLLSQSFGSISPG